MNIRIIQTPSDCIPRDEYEKLCMVLKVNNDNEDESNYVTNQLITFGVETPILNLNNTFMCVSSDKTHKIDGGVFALNNDDLRKSPYYIPQNQFNDKRNIRFHKIDTIILDYRLFTKEWLEYAVHTILTNIVDEQNKNLLEVLWFDYKGILYPFVLDKDYDENGNLYISESSKITSFLLKTFFE